MDVVTAVDLLRRIYLLRNAIIRQRRVNRRTYVRMMEIYFVLQSSEAVVTNGTMRRTAALEKFSTAAINFWQYLQKYNRMCRLVRLFKFVAMEEQRLTIVEEIDQLFRMLNLATAVTVMTSAADASRNAKMLFETLENMHGDIKLTHEEILKVLFTDKQRSDMKLQRIVLDNDVVDRVGVDRVLVHQVSMLSYNGALETADPLHIVEGSPRAVDGGNTMVKTEWGVRSDEVEEESPVYTNELESITADVVPRTRMPTVQEVLGDINPAAAHEDKEGEEKEPSIRQLTPAQDVADEPTDENKSSCHEEPAPIQNTVDKAVESKNKEEEREPSSQQCASVPATVDNVIDEEEEKGENEQQSLIRPSVDESIEEQEEQEIEPRDEQLDEMVEGKEHEGNEVSIEQPASMQDSADEVLDENETEENGEASDQHPAEVVEGKDLSGNHSARIQATTDDAIETEENNLSDQQSRVAVDDKDIETVEHEQIEKNGPKSSQPAPTRDTADEMVEDEREKESGPSTEKSDVLVEVAKAEENEPSDDQSAVMQDTTNYEVEEDVQATDDEVVEEEKGEEDESISGQPEPMTGEPIYDQIEEMVENNEGNEANSLRSASFSDTTTDEETDEVYQVRLEPSSVALLIQRLGSDQVPAQQQEDTLLDLLGMCVTHTNRVQIYKTKGIPVLTNLVRNGETFLTQLYALHCLSWFTFSFSKIREYEFEELHSHVREPTHVEMLTLLHELQSCDDGVKERAALQCSCMATRGVADALRQVGVLPLLIDLLKNGTTNQKLWATEALLTLASDNDENCVAITRGGAIPLLVSLLRTGTDMHKQEAAYALGNLAANNEVNRAKIAREGAIPPLVKFVKSVTDAQNQWAVFALGCLSLNNEENRVLIAQEGAIRPLVELLRVGKRGQKQWAAYTLGNLAQNDANLEEITLEGAIAPLIQLLKSGTVMQKQRAAFALGNLACDNDMAADFDEAILPLVDLVRMGSDTQKEDAAYTLGNLAANNDARRAEIGRKGAITPLVNLLKTGDGDQKQWAAFALRWLAYDNESNRAAIVEVGAIASLTVLMEEGTDDQKKEAAHALEHLDVKSDTTVDTFISDRIKTQLMGYFNADAISQNANVATTAALNTLGTVREGVLPLFRRFMKADAEAENESASQNGARATPKAANKVHDMAGAW